MHTKINVTHLEIFTAEIKQFYTVTHMKLNIGIFGQDDPG
jgi:hypothetical protein